MQAKREWERILEGRMGNFGIRRERILKEKWESLEW
jgi:hypothetical protein